jgi:hypothetical protein
MMFEKKDEYQWEDYPKSLGRAVLDKIREEWYDKKMEADKEAYAWTDSRYDSYWAGKTDGLQEMLDLLDLRDDD